MATDESAEGAARYERQSELERAVVGTEEALSGATAQLLGVNLTPPYPSPLT